MHGMKREYFGPQRRFATGTLFALWAFAVGCVEARGSAREQNMDGLGDPADVPPHDAAALDGAHAAVSDSAPARANDAAALDGAHATAPDGASAQAVAQDLASGGVLYPCRTRLSSSSFALDTSTCASRPAALCPTRDAGVDPRYRDPLQPSDDIAYELFHECARGQGNFPVGVTFTEQGCADRFYSVPFPPDDELLQCYLRVLQARRYPCGITCSHYIRLD